MIGDYEIVEYKNPYFPERTYYCATLENGMTKHHTDFEVVVEWLLDRIVRAKYYEQKEACSDLIRRAREKEESCQRLSLAEADMVIRSPRISLKF